MCKGIKLIFVEWKLSDFFEHIVKNNVWRTTKSENITSPLINSVSKIELLVN